MALPPGIPTSFVPKQPVQTLARRSRSGNNLFLIACIGVGVVAIVISGILFGYQKYLEGVSTAKTAQLAAEQKGIDTDTVDQFIRLRDRLVSAQTLLNQHVGLSQFFDVLESLTLQNVKFDSLEVKINDDHSAHIQMSGIAKTFNALAAQSNAFAGEKRIKRAIFSGITVDKNNVISFTLSADLDSRLIVIAQPASIAVLSPAADATTTPAVVVPAGPATSTPPKKP